MASGGIKLETPGDPLCQLQVRLGRQTSKEAQGMVAQAGNCAFAEVSGCAVDARAGRAAGAADSLRPDTMRLFLQAQTLFLPLTWVRPCAA